jgi:hypothetical protein
MIHLGYLLKMYIFPKFRPHLHSSVLHHVEKMSYMQLWGLFFNTMYIVKYIIVLKRLFYIYCVSQLGN